MERRRKGCSEKEEQSGVTQAQLDHSHTPNHKVPLSASFPVVTKIPDERNVRKERFIVMVSLKRDMAYYGREVMGTGALSKADRKEGWAINPQGPPSSDSHPPLPQQHHDLGTTSIQTYGRHFTFKQESLI